LGCNVDGFETNPFMAFLSRVKARDYSSVKNLETLALQCLSGRARSGEFALPNDTTLVERRGLKKWLLNKRVATRFEQLRTSVARVWPPSARDLLLLAVMASTEKVANARKDGKCWRYKSRWQDLKYDEQNLDDEFARQVLRFSEDIERCPRLLGRVRISRADSRRLASRIGADRTYDGLFTSPPYLNSFDYTDIYRPELLMLKQASNAAELRRMRFATLRSHVQVAWKSSPSLAIRLLQEKINAVSEADLWCGRIPDMINAYFVDLDRVIEQCSRYLKKGARAGFVVADSAYNGIVIPVDVVLGAILERRGFTPTDTVVFRETLGNGNHQQKSDKQLREVLLLAQFKGLPS